MPESSRPARGANAEHITAIRRFNRFYTRQIGVLEEGLARSPFSLTEARVVWELAHTPDATASQLSERLGIDPGYLSRILKSFETRKLVQRRVAPGDGRQMTLRLTAQGRRAFTQLDDATNADVGQLLDVIDSPDAVRLTRAMADIEQVLSGSRAPEAPYVLRPHAPGDMGYVVSRQALLYSREFGWDVRFEALVSRIVADFLDHFDPACERCWIAERAGEIVGSVFIVKHPERPGVAKLRMLYVERSARGLGIGRHLVEECTRFARTHGYHTITLWTNSVLASARRLYEAEGYTLIDETPHTSWGHELVSETWEKSLHTANGPR